MHLPSGTGSNSRLTRLRWRMRGAWLWPAFVVLTLLDGLLLRALPIAGERMGFVPGALLGGFLNLVVVAVLAPALRGPLRRRRPGLPPDVATGYVGTALVALVTLGLLGAGLRHRPHRQDEQREVAAQADAVRRYVLASAPEYHGGLSRPSTIRVDSGLYRTCIPGADPKRPLCLLVQTTDGRGTVRVDPNRATNESYTRRTGPGS